MSGVGNGDERIQFRLRGRRAELITDAKKSSYQSRRHRQKWYTILQLSRLPTMALAGISYFYWDNLYLTIFFFLLAVPAPGLAVIFANEKVEKKDKRERNTYKPAVVRQLRYDQLQAAERRAQLKAAEEKKNQPVIIEHEDITDHDQPQP